MSVPSRLLARRALVIVAVVALLEIVLGWRAYTDRITDDDWALARDAIEALPPGEPVYLATEWLGPRARMELPSMRGLDEVARPDLRGHAVFHVLGLGKDAWSDRLHADLEGDPMPRRVEQRSVGSLSLTTYEQPAAGRVLASLLDSHDLQVRSDAGPCRGQNPWRCGDGSVQPMVAEIDYKPRRCMGIDVADGRIVSLTLPAMPTGDALRGHVGFHDFNRRLRSDAPVTLTVRIDDRVMARWVVTDEQGWWPFVVPTAAGRHEVTLELQTAVRGTWAHDGHRPNEPRTVCVELRSLEEPTP